MKNLYSFIFKTEHGTTRNGDANTIETRYNTTALSPADAYSNVDLIPSFDEDVDLHDGVFVVLCNGAETNNTREFSARFKAEFDRSRIDD